MNGAELNITAVVAVIGYWTYIILCSIIIIIIIIFKYLDKKSSDAWNNCGSR